MLMTFNFGRQLRLAGRRCRHLKNVGGKQTAGVIFQVRGSIVVSISACHAEDPGSIPGRGAIC